MYICIFHGNCADGFTAAWVVLRKLGDQVEFHAGKFQEAPPDVTGKDVILVDFSYKRPIIEQMARQANSILILDHHKSAQADLDDLRMINVHSVFDMNRSGARIAWDWFFPFEAPPQLLLHVEDRDLWRFALPFTREIQANLFSYPYDFKTWDILMAADIQDLHHDGCAIERKHFKDITELLPIVTREMRIGAYIVPVANLPYIFSSDAGHQLAQGRPFAGCYWDTPDGRVFSLRSTDNGIDVSEVAKQYGGGGHRNASGFCVSFAQARTFEIGE